MTSYEVDRKRNGQTPALAPSKLKNVDVKLDHGCHKYMRSMKAILFAVVDVEHRRALGALLGQIVCEGAQRRIPAFPTTKCSGSHLCLGNCQDWVKTVASYTYTGLWMSTSIRNLCEPRFFILMRLMDLTIDLNLIFVVWWS